MPPTISCPQCRVALVEGVFNRPNPAPCQYCGTPLVIEVFPALFRPIAPGQTAEAVMVEGESSCFFHPQKKAVVPCGSCGRFLCALCDCALNGEHYCPTCLETGKSKGKIQALKNRHTRYDRLALTLSIAPMLLFYFTLITAPIVLFLTFRYWKASVSPVSKSRVRFIIASVLALLQLGGWTVFFIFLARSH
jgi:hypothetical protein